MAKELTAKFKNRADTATNWASANPILDLGEIGLEKDTSKIKFGNGVSTWNNLPYYSDIAKDAAKVTIEDTGSHYTSGNVEGVLQEVGEQINSLGAELSRSATVVVAASDSKFKKYADYLCDGTDDQVEINNAITALPATGGEIVILDGTYNITAKIDVTKDNISIRGNGNATILKRMFNSSTKEGVITLTGRSGCKIANLQIEGNKTSYTNNNNYGIYLDVSSDNTITGNTCNNNNRGIYLYSSSNNTVTGNTYYNNNSYGIYLGSSSDSTVTGNTCNNNNYGVYSGFSSNNTVTGNTCYNNQSQGIYLGSSNNNTVTGNTCYNNNDYGIRLGSSSDNTVTGNTCYNNSYGIRLYSSNSNTVTGNTCIRGTGQTSDYASDQYTILLSGTSNNYNLISSNNCMGKSVTIEGGTGNTVINNKWNETSDFEDLRTDVGDKSSLTTDNKTNLVSAINEHETQINSLDAEVGLGGVVESGTNENGTYVKFEDGTVLGWYDFRKDLPSPLSSVGDFIRFNLELVAPTQGLIVERAILHVWGRAAGGGGVRAPILALGRPDETMIFTRVVTDKATTGDIVAPCSHVAGSVFYMGRWK